MSEEEIDQVYGELDDALWDLEEALEEVRACRVALRSSITDLFFGTKFRPLTDQMMDR